MTSDSLFIFEALRWFDLNSSETSVGSTFVLNSNQSRSFGVDSERSFNLFYFVQCIPLCLIFGDYIIR